MQFFLEKKLGISPMFFIYSIGSGSASFFPMRGLKRARQKTGGAALYVSFLLACFLVCFPQTKPGHRPHGPDHAGSTGHRNRVGSVMQGGWQGPKRGGRGIGQGQHWEGWLWGGQGKFWGGYNPPRSSVVPPLSIGFG